MRRIKNSPVLLLLILMVVSNLLSNGFSNPMDWFMSKIIMLPGIIIGLSFHEFAHGYVSHKLGDPTPEMQGRLTINPAAHIDPFGFVALIFAGFGWGVPVQIDPRYYKNRRRGELMVGLAGVTMNLIIAVVFCFIIKGVFLLNPPFLAGTLGQVLIDILLSVVSINVVLMVFNLLPVPPLDGFGIVTQIFKLDKYDWYYTVYNNGFPILMVLIILNVTGRVLTPIVSTVMSFLVNTIIF